MRGTFGTSGMSLVIFLVIRLFSFSNVCAVCTLGNAWARSSCFSVLVCGVGFYDFEMALLLFTDSSVQFICPVIAAYVFDGFVTISYGGHNFFGIGDVGFCDFLMAGLGGVGESLNVGCLNVA